MARTYARLYSLRRWVDDVEFSHPQSLETQVAAVVASWTVTVSVGIWSMAVVAVSGAASAERGNAGAFLWYTYRRTSCCLQDPGATVAAVHLVWYVTGLANVCHYLCIGNQNKKLRTNPWSSLQYFQAGNPRDRGHMNIVGPFLENHQDNKYVLIMVDQFARWLELQALWVQDAVTVAQAFFESYAIYHQVWGTVNQQVLNFLSA